MAVFKGDIGTVIEIDLDEDISSGITFAIHYKKPSGATGSWTATRSGTKITYTTADVNTLDEVGTWNLQAYITMPAWTGRSTITSFSVLDVLYTPAGP